MFSLGRAPAALLLALVACPRGDDAPSDAPGDADADADADVDTDTDADADPVPDDGHATLAFVRADQDPPLAFFLAQFYRELTPAVDGVAFQDAPGPDACGLTLYTLAELGGGAAATYDRQPAGAVDLVGPGVHLTLQPDPSLDQQYYAVLDAAAFPFGAAWDVTAAGDVFPAFAEVAAIQGPADWTVLAPPPAFHLDGALDLAWTAGDADPLVLRLATSDADGNRGLILCQITNDGQFTVPAELVDQLPAGRATAQLEQSRASTVEVSGRRIRFEGLVSAVVVGSKP